MIGCTNPCCVYKLVFCLLCVLSHKNYLFGTYILLYLSYGADCYCSSANMQNMWPGEVIGSFCESLHRYHYKQLRFLQESAETTVQRWVFRATHYGQKCNFGNGSPNVVCFINKERTVCRYPSLL